MGNVRRQTGTATVFVDDFVEERLPAVSVISGEPASHLLRRKRVVDSPSSAWLLLLLVVPFGWIAVAFIFLTGRRSTLVGYVPIREAEYQLMRSRRRIAPLLAVVSVLTLVLGLFAEPTVPLVFTGLLTLVLLLAAAVVGVVTSLERPMVELDASRRWVTIDNVHPNFARACRERSRPQVGNRDVSPTPHRV
jgi:hypothetical protein